MLQNNEEVLTPAEVARLLRLGRATTYALLRSGQIPSVRLRKKILVPRAALKRLLAGTDAQGETVEREVRDRG